MHELRPSYRGCPQPALPSSFFVPRSYLTTVRLLFELRSDIILPPRSLRQLHLLSDNLFFAKHGSIGADTVTPQLTATVMQITNQSKSRTEDVRSSGRVRAGSPCLGLLDILPHQTFFPQLDSCNMSTSLEFTKSDRKAQQLPTIIDHKSYNDLYTGRSDLADNIATQLLKEIEVGEGHDPVVLTTIRNAHFGIPDPMGGDGLVYPDGPISVYNFMKGPQAQIPEWIQTKLPPKPSRTEADSANWSMEDIPDPIIMSAAAKVSLKLQDLQEPLTCDGTSLGYMDKSIEALSNRSEPVQPSRMFLLVKTAEVAACQEYLSDNPSKEVINTFFNWSDILTRSRARNATPRSTPRILSERSSHTITSDGRGIGHKRA
jgi:hypothetical protein